MRQKIAGITAILLVAAVPFLFAGGSQEATAETGPEDFSTRLETALANSDFSEEEAAEIAETVRSRSGGEAEEADAEIVARAIGLAKRENADMDAERSGELALELARNSVRLREENYGDEVVAEATLEAVRSMLGQIEEWKSGDGSEKLGEIVRSTVSSEVQKATQKRASDKAAEGKSKTGKGKASEAASGSPAGDNPGSSTADR